MGSDAARPRDDEFKQVLDENLETWSSYLDLGSEICYLPRQAIDFLNLVDRTPLFLGDTLAPDEIFSFFCEKNYSSQGKDGLVVNGRSIWKTSKRDL